MWRAFQKSRSEIPPRVEDYPVLILHFLVLHLEPDFCFYCFLQGKPAAVVTLPVIPFKHCFGILFFFFYMYLSAQVWCIFQNVHVSVHVHVFVCGHSYLHLCANIQIMCVWCVRAWETPSPGVQQQNARKQGSVKERERQRTFFLKHVCFDLLRKRENFLLKTVHLFWSLLQRQTHVLSHTLFTTFHTCVAL